MPALYEGLIIEVKPDYSAIGEDGNDYSSEIQYAVRKRAIDVGMTSIQVKMYSTGSKKGKLWLSFIKDNKSSSKLSPSNTSTVSNQTTLPIQKALTTRELLDRIKPVTAPTVDDNEDLIVNFIRDAESFQPKFLKMSSIKWRMLIRSVVRGSNVLMIGEKGEGKTVTVQTIAKVLDRPLFTFNCGNMQDAQTALLGKTHLKDQNTVFKASHFVEAITTPNAIVLLDEMSRLGDDAQNILIPVVDKNQSYLRLSEAEDSAIIPVAPGVSFIGTANFGNTYTATNSVDSALMDRFTKVEVDSISVTERMSLLSMLYPGVDKDYIKAVAEVAKEIRDNALSSSPNLQTYLSTRTCIDMCALLQDGFTFLEVAEVAIYPNYVDQDERIFAKQLVQKKSNVDDVVKNKKNTTSKSSTSNKYFNDTDFKSV